MSLLNIIPIIGTLFISILLIKVVMSSTDTLRDNHK